MIVSGGIYRSTRKFFRDSSRQVYTVVMLRHGESLWNQEKRFTGWSDVPLTEAGEADAKDAGMLIGERNIKFDVAFTSNLERAWRTCAIALAASKQSSVEVVRSWRLNERHYGALQGHEKNCPKLIKIFGEHKVIDWRRSYLSTPPSLYNIDFLKAMGGGSLEKCTSWMNPKYINRERYLQTKRVVGGPDLDLTASTSYSPQSKLLQDLSESDIFPVTESLKQCQERAYYFWQNTIAPRVKSGDRVLIVAHANTIRALVKAVDNIDDDSISHLRIPNGIPLVYTLDENLKPVVNLSDDIGFHANYLVSARNHSKMMAYERCVKKKMRSLFEYLDTDNDGRITHECLLQGLNRLKTLELSSLGECSVYDDLPGEGVEKKLQYELCEYEVNELIRNVPDADREEGITLQEFLDAESTLLPQLTKLRLLQ